MRECPALDCTTGVCIALPSVAVCDTTLPVPSLTPSCPTLNTSTPSVLVTVRLWPAISVLCFSTSLLEEEDSSTCLGETRWREGAEVEIYKTIYW